MALRRAALCLSSLPAALAFGTLPPRAGDGGLVVVGNENTAQDPNDHWAASQDPNYHCQDKDFASTPISGFACIECLADCDHPKRQAAGCSRAFCDTYHVDRICSCDSHPIFDVSTGQCVSDVEDCPFAIGRNAGGGRDLCARIQDPNEEVDLVDLQALPDKPWCSSRSNDKEECERSYLSGEVAKNGLPTVTPCIMYGDGSCVADWGLLMDCDYAPVAAFCQAVAGKEDVQQRGEWCNTDPERRGDAAKCGAAFVGGTNAYALCEHDAAADNGNGKCTAGSWVTYPPNVPDGRSAIEECGCSPTCDA